jgi:hypothetical protein
MSGVTTLKSQETTWKGVSGGTAHRSQETVWKAMGLFEKHRKGSSVTVPKYREECLKKILLYSVGQQIELEVFTIF